MAFASYLRLLSRPTPRVPLSLSTKALTLYPAQRAPARCAGEGRLAANPPIDEVSSLTLPGHMYARHGSIVDDREPATICGHGRRRANRGSPRPLQDRIYLALTSGYRVNRTPEGRPSAPVSEVEGTAA